MYDGEVSQVSHGNFSQNYAVYGNIIGNQTIIKQLVQSSYQETAFYTPNLEDKEPPDFRSPPIAARLPDVLQHQRILVLAGPNQQEKGLLLEHLACLLRAKLQGPYGLPQDAEVEVRECVCGPSRLKIEESLAESGSPGIFIIRRAQRFHFDRGLQDLRQLAAAKNKFLLIGTEGVDTQWGFSSGARPPFWHQLTDAEIYPSDYLARSLCDRLKKETTRFQEEGGDGIPGLFPEGVPGGLAEPREVLLLQGLSCQEAVNGLSTPSHIIRLVDWMISPPRPIAPEQLRAHVRRLKGDKASIRDWFARLEARQQILAVGLLLFDGLYDDQVFGALDKVVDKAWRRHEPGFPRFDQRDLDRLDGYFRPLWTSNLGRTLECTLPDHVLLILQEAWNLHRRKMLAALPVVSQIVLEAAGRPASGSPNVGPGVTVSRAMSSPFEGSVEDAEAPHATPDTGGDDVAAFPFDPRRYDNPIPFWRPYGSARELYGSRPRRQRLYAMIAENLGRLVHVAPHGVERCLIELATHSAPDAQAVAAQALASLHDDQQLHQHLYRVLNRWYGSPDKGGRETPPRLIEREERVTDYTRRRETIVMTISRIALQQEPGHLCDKIPRWLRKVADDPSRKVRMRVRDEAVPSTVARHLGQLEPTLRSLVQHTELTVSVAFAWAEASRQRPLEAGTLLGQWYEELTAIAPVPPHPEEAPRELRLATVALVFGLFDYDSEGSPLTVGQACRCLRRILEEPHSRVRESALTAVAELIDRRFHAVEQYLPEILQEVKVVERPSVIDPLIRFSEQWRQALMETGSDRDPRSHSGPGPQDLRLTPVETALHRWVLDESRPAAQQLAFATLLDLSERSRILQPDGAGVAGYSPTRQEPQFRAVDASDGDSSVRTHAPSMGQSLFSLLTLGRQNWKRVLLPLLPELHFRLSWRKLWTRNTLRWWAVDGGPLAVVGKPLSRYVALWEARWFLLPLLVAIAFIVWILSILAA